MNGQTDKVSYRAGVKGKKKDRENLENHRKSQNL